MVTREQAQYIAGLAKLRFEGEELDRIVLELQSILDLAQEITTIDTDHINPMEHVQSVKNVLRDDGEPVPFPREALLANAPEQADGCFTVPKVLE